MFQEGVIRGLYNLNVLRFKGDITTVAIVPHSNLLLEGS